MKSTRMLTILVLALGVMVWSAKVGEAAPMGTAFTYQGRLIDANSAADGLYDFAFKLYNDPCTGFQQGSAIDINELDVIDGYFTVELDFGSAVFNGDARWLEIGVRAGELEDPNAYTTLSPRQEITPVPYALQTRGIFVDNSGKVGIGTTSPAAKLTVDGAILRSGSTMYGAEADTHINLGTSSTTGESGDTYAFATVGGGRNNTASTYYTTVGGGGSNTASGFQGTVGGGSYNTASGQNATVSGGSHNTASGSKSTVGGGEINNTSGFNSTVGGGSNNTTSGSLSTVGGGYYNTASDYQATVGGGYNNTASNNQATVPGGRGNVAGGYYSFAAGQRAKVRDTAASGDDDGDEGTFVWADSTDADFQSTGPDQFLIRASGGVGIATNSPQGTLDVNGSIYQRGSVLYADYVFELGYELESIDEHSEFMWKNKHLKAIPKANLDENGREILEVGAHRKGIVEELEKAHIYIEQLHERIGALEKKLERLEIMANGKK